MTDLASFWFGSAAVLFAVGYTAGLVRSYLRRLVNAV